MRPAAGGSDGSQPQPGTVDIEKSENFIFFFNLTFISKRRRGGHADKEHAGTYPDTLKTNDPKHSR
jgi:hypothetical protein